MVFNLGTGDWDSSDTDGGVCLTPSSPRSKIPSSLLRCVDDDTCMDTDDTKMDETPVCGTSLWCSSL